MNSQKEKLDAKDVEIQKLTAALQAQLGKTSKGDGSPTDSHSGESTLEGKMLTDSPQ